TKTITTTREPALAVTADSLRFELSKLVICENIDLVEKEIRPEGSPSTFKLEVNVINGENLPSDKNELKELGKQVMAIVKSRLKDVEKFDTCFVLFETQSGSGAVKTK